MTDPADGRPGFRDWVDRHDAPDEWKLLPLTHITKGLVATDIMRAGQVAPSPPAGPLDQAYAYFFYGRPAYRVSDSEVVKIEASCPHCFIFRPDLFRRANRVFAFDTGAFGARMYKHVLDEQFQVGDFRIDGASGRPNKLIRASFGDQESYFEADRGAIVEAQVAAEPHEMEARAYLELIKSPGRNEPDDRICSIEVVFADPVPLSGELIGVVVPHTLWSSASRSPLLQDLHSTGVAVIPYDFIPNRHPEHYHTLLEAAVREFYIKEGFLRERQ